jgi:membrane-associated phospholipid phosphatase
MSTCCARVVALTLAASVGCAEPTVAPERAEDVDVSAWRTWTLSSASELRPSSPPSGVTEEIEEVVRLQSERTSATDSIVRFWDGDPTSHWTRIAVERLDFYWPLLPDVRIATPVRAARTMALLHVALHDAMVATWDAKLAYQRASPARKDSRVRALVADRGSSYPSEHAAASAAASTILMYAIPLDDSGAMTRRAREAAQSRIVAGVAHRTDVEAGWAIGRAVAQRVYEWARADGSDELWTGALPTGDGTWRPTPPRRVQAPFDPLAGRWKTWVLPSGSALRLPPPPSLGSAAFVRDVDELRRLSDGVRTEQQANIARFWATDAPSTRWEAFVDDELSRRRWSTPWAARARAYVSVAMYEAFVACWDSKYTHWLARPVTVEPGIRTVFGTPPFPSYPSGHSTISTSAAVVMGALFPDRASEYLHRAEEASLSRIYGGVHYRFDVVDGDSLGARVGREVIARMRSDGARQR